ncbi:hypothetical protein CHINAEXTREME_18325 [Halobiforma lacisalsi AJ5]|uniref:DUF8147 domain-containing protein n=1 Tax=Natronobacterium lacisalsi AJ5 TaxID=358396 RepID=M0LQ62_NATLA|nr:hypothetical protein [Halobiforma lacisalsi]APW99605.1 hypothetical protein CHINAEXTREME_18325 [Halobiforma lacisalsi AJ5]EMA35611.1 hypothetical protein C445_05243 [Halobiforma lacisalsi AJ5]
MNTVLKLVGSLFVGVLAFLVVGIGVTEALDPYVWPSLMLGLPAGLVAGIALIPLTYLGFTYREEVAATGQASERTARRLRATVAGIAGFVVGGGLATAALSTGAVGLATAMLFGGLPVGLVVAAVAAFLASRRGRSDRTAPGSPPANSS